MKKLTKNLIAILIICIVLLFSFNEVLAVNLNTINENSIEENNELVSDTSNNELDDENIDNFEPEEDNHKNKTNGNKNIETSSHPVQVTTTQNKDTGLTFEGAATIILIAIGIVLIFLAIAILIRCK